VPLEAQSYDRWNQLLVLDSSRGYVWDFQAHREFWCFLSWRNRQKYGPWSVYASGSLWQTLARFHRLATWTNVRRPFPFSDKDLWSFSQYFWIFIFPSIFGFFSPPQRPTSAVPWFFSAWDVIFLCTSSPQRCWLYRASRPQIWPSDILDNSVRYALLGSQLVISSRLNRCTSFCLKWLCLLPFGSVRWVCRREIKTSGAIGGSTGFLCGWWWGH